MSVRIQSGKQKYYEHRGMRNLLWNTSSRRCRSHWGGEVCKEELENQRKVTNKPSKPGDVQLLEWDHKVALVERTMEGCFSVSGVTTGQQHQQMGGRAGRGVRTTEDKLESACRFTFLFHTSNRGDFQSLMATALLLPSKPLTHFFLGQV